MSAEIKHHFLESEKSNILKSFNQLVLITSRFETKESIKLLLQGKYGAEVIKINSVICKGKEKFRRKKKIKLPDKKKFYITIKDKIENFNKMDNENA